MSLSLRCIEDLEDHFDKSVLSKLPDRYKSSVKQSVISEEDDMGNAFILCKLMLVTFFLYPSWCVVYMFMRSVREFCILLSLNNRR